MLSDEILKLHERLEKRRNRTPEEINAASPKEDEHLANLANSTGWEVLRGKMEGMIAELLEPMEFPEDVPMDVRGAVAEARWYCLKFVRDIISQVESAKSVKIAQKTVNSEEKQEKA